MSEPASTTPPWEDPMARAYAELSGRVAYLLTRFRESDILAEVMRQHPGPDRKVYVWYKFDKETKSTQAKRPKRKASQPQTDRAPCQESEP